MKNAPKKLKVACIQQAYQENYTKNLTATIEAIKEAAAQGAQLVLLRELFASLYFCQTENAETFELAEPIPGPTTQALAEAARENNVVIVTSIFEKTRTRSLS